MSTNLNTDKGYDLVVLGSGAAGMSAAITGAYLGQRVLVIEKDSVLGGTTAWSGGWIWSPRNLFAKRRGINETPETIKTYLQSVLGEYFDEARVDRFIEAVPQMMEFFETNTSLQFEGDQGIPDTYGHQPGAGMGGRSAIAKPFDAKILGKHFNLLKKPLKETTFHGLMIQSGPDLRAFMTMTRSIKSLMHVSRRMIRFIWDLLIYRRSTDLRNGNALIGRMIKSAVDLGVEFKTGAEVQSLIINQNRVEGVMLAGEEIRANRGIILACGGFPHNARRRQGLYKHNDQHQTLATPSATGDGLSLAEQAGGRLKMDTAEPAAYCPVSIVPWGDNKSGVFPHIIDRGKPGLIAVNRSGKRFCNEGLGYHDFVTALQASVEDDESATAWVVCDHRFIRRFGLGIVRPFPVPFKHWINRGYLKVGKTPRELAENCGFDADAFETTLKQWNEGAQRGEDPEFGRGTTAYMRLQGDPEQKPNPCVAPIETGPFYAVEVVPGSFGTFAGIDVNQNGSVLNARGEVIPGLYAAGTDSASVFGGFYPAGGINIGPALTFGYVAAKHAADQGKAHA